MLAAFALSKRFIPGRKAILFFFMLPMFIGGSIISFYVVLVKIGMQNSFLVYILPGCFSFFSMVIMRTFIEGIPSEVEESAMIDGANYWQIFIKIILPVSKPVMAAFAFFAVVGGWLDLYTNLLFVTKRELFVLQYILFMVIKSSEANSLVDAAKNSDMIQRMIAERMHAEKPTPEVIKMAVMAVVTFPLLFIYPFFQKYFISGMMVGAIKA
jgi:putative aldouronate transport system permease protein